MITNEQCKIYEVNGITLALPDGLSNPGIEAKLADGTYEADEARAVDRAVRPGFRVLDLGGGLGYVSALAAKKCGAENVLCVEANPDLVPVIEHNHKVNGVGDTSVMHGAVVGRAREGAMAGFHQAHGFTGSRLAAGGASVRVPLIGLHDLLRAHRPHVVLIDVEGAEEDYFERNWACPLRFCVMELHPKAYGPDVIKKIVDRMSAMNMTYDPVVSRGKVLGFRRVWSAEAD